MHSHRLIDCAWSLWTLRLKTGRSVHHIDDLCTAIRWMFRRLPRKRSKIVEINIVKSQLLTNSKSELKLKKKKKKRVSATPTTTATTTTTAAPPPPPPPPTTTNY